MNNTTSTETIVREFEFIKNDKEPVLSLIAHKEVYLIVLETASIKIIDLRTGKASKVWNNNPKRIKKYKNTLFVTTTKDNKIYSYDLEDLEALPREYEGCTKWITDIQVHLFDNKKLKLFASSADNQCCEWNVPHPSAPNNKAHPPSMVFKGHTDYVNKILLADDGTTLYTASCDKTIRKWNTMNGMQDKEFAGTGHENWVFSIIYNTNNSKLYSSSKDGTAREWNIKTGISERIFKIGSPCFDLSLKDNLLLVIDTNAVTIWSLKSGKRFSTLDGHSGKVTCMNTEEDPKLIVTGSKDNSMRVWEKKGKCTMILRGCEQPINNFVVMGGFIYSASQDGSIRKWTFPRSKDEKVVQLDPKTKAIVKCQAIMRGHLVRKNLVKKSKSYFIFYFYFVYVL